MATEIKLNAFLVEKTIINPPPPQVVDYVFEVSGIHIYGNKKMALLAYKNVKQRKFTEPVMVREEQTITGTDYRVTEISPGMVKLENSQGKQQACEFSIKEVRKAPTGVHVKPTVKSVVEGKLK